MAVLQTIVFDDGGQACSQVVINGAAATGFIAVFHHSPVVKHRPAILEIGATGLLMTGQQRLVVIMELTSNQVTGVNHLVEIAGVVIAITYSRLIVMAQCRNAVRKAFVSVFQLQRHGVGTVADLAQALLFVVAQQQRIIIFVAERH